MEVKRDGRWYRVVDEYDTDYLVECEFDFAQPLRKRILELWWSKEYIEDVRN